MLNRAVHNSRRGVSLIAVLGLLVLLVFVVVTMFYLVTLESRSAALYGWRIQNRYDAAATRPYLASLAAQITSSPLESAGDALKVAKGKRTATGVVEEFEDLSARVNVNAVRDAQAFARFLDASVVVEPDAISTGTVGAQGARQVFSSGAAGMKIVRAIKSAERADPPTKPEDKATTKAATEKVTKQTAKAAAQDANKEEDKAGVQFVDREQPYKTLGDLALAVAGDDAPFTKKQLEQIAPFVTTFSEASEQAIAPSGKLVARLPRERMTSEPLVVWKQLTAMYPQKNKQLLMQYAVNISDYFDADDVPTMMYADRNQKLETAALGVEPTVMISEVYADSRYSMAEGDGGQFVEFHNPWSKSVSMANWKLDIHAANGELERSVIISAIVGPGETLVVTDNYDNKNGNAASKGLKSIFGAPPMGLAAVYEAAGLDLPDFGGMVVLRNADDAVMDIFTYTTTGEYDSLNSFQRDDPTVRAAGVLMGTPYRAYNKVDEVTGVGYAGARAKARELLADKGECTSPLELMRVSTGFADGKAQSARGWQLPVYAAQDAKGNATVDNDNLDASVANLFVAGTQVIVESDETSTVYTRGKLNVNECAPAALLSLDARDKGEFVVTETIAQKLDGKRFASPMDFVRAVVPKLETEAQFNAAVRLLDTVCVSSTSYLARVGAWREKPPREGMSYPGVELVSISGGPAGNPVVTGVHRD